MKSNPNIISIALIGVGVAGFAFASRPLVKNKDIDVPLNVLGINRSPYGEVFAMAMQGPIDTFFHATESKAHSCDVPATCQHQTTEPKQEPASGKHTAPDDRLRHFIDGMGAGLVERTNPTAASEAHKFFLRRGIEDKLRFAYNLDPGHYGNYNAYHFFLTEPELGTRPELTPTAAKLAEETITYCLSRRDDPRLALTAAAAAGNVIELMFSDRHVNPGNPRFSTGQMRSLLDVSDQAIALFSGICQEWTEQGLWENLSALRLMEIEERSRFVYKIRESQGKAIALLEITPFSYGVENPADAWRTTRDLKTDPFGYGVVPGRKSPKPDTGNAENLSRKSQGSSQSGRNTASLSE